MKAKTFIVAVLLVLLCCFKAQAQGQFSKPLRSSNRSKLGVSDYNIGLKLGCPWSYMTKSDLDQTTYDGNFGYLAGLIFERNLGKWSVALESTFAQKGTKMHNEKPYQISLTEDGIVRTTYAVAYNVATVRIPVTYYFQGMIKDDKVIPYLFAGPEVDIALPFNYDLLHSSFDQEVIAITKKYDGPTGEDFYMEAHTPFNPPINISAVAGLGFMTKIRIENNAIYFRFDAAYNHGLMNLALPTKEGWKWPFETQEPRVFAHDVEVNFSIVYPIKKILHDACHNIQ